MADQLRQRKEPCTNALRGNLIEELKKGFSKEVRIVIMPYFCIDNFIQYGRDYESFIADMGKIADRGGGNTVVKQGLRLGGKAANCASALASLDIYTHLVTRTSKLGYQILQTSFQGKSVDLSHVSQDGKLAFTSAIELGGVNIMLNDPGSLSQFGPENLTQETESLIKQADIACVSDWGLNGKGTELARHVFSIAREGKKCKTFFDPGDLSLKEGKGDINRLIHDVLRGGLVDIISINEDEDKGLEEQGFNIGGTHFREAVRIDLHTKRYARTLYKDGESENIPTFDINPGRLTGAGDAWDAGNILGEVMGLPDDLRLMLANATAAFYISHEEGRHPNKKDLIDFLQEAPLKQRNRLV